MTYYKKYLKYKSKYLGGSIFSGFDNDYTVNFEFKNVAGNTLLNIPYK